MKEGLRPSAEIISVLHADRVVRYRFGIIGDLMAGRLNSSRSGGEIHLFRTYYLPPKFCRFYISRIRSSTHGTRLLRRWNPCHAIKRQDESGDIRKG